jgi:uncharacterized protein
MNELLKTLLLEWQERKLPELLERNIKLDISNSLPTNMATAITGFRRVSKTYLMFIAIKELLSSFSRQEVVYINFEDERILPTVDILTDLIPEIVSIYGKSQSICSWMNCS